MKKLVATAMMIAVLSVFSGSAFAANMVSEMAVQKGGRSVAACAQMMDRGVSECATADTCSH